MVSASIVVRVADATHRRLDAGLRQALGVSDGDVLGGFKRSSQHLDGSCDDHLNPPWLPLSLWCTSLLPCTGRRSWRACSRASRTKLACAVRLTRQPTIRRA